MLSILTVVTVGVSSFKESVMLLTSFRSPIIGISSWSSSGVKVRNITLVILFSKRFGQENLPFLEVHYQGILKVHCKNILTHHPKIPPLPLVIA